MYISNIYIYIHDYIPIFASQNPTISTTSTLGHFQAGIR